MITGAPFTVAPSFWQVVEYCAIFPEDFHVLECLSFAFIFESSFE